MTTKTTQHLPQLDGLRAAAVTLVVIYHVVQGRHGPLVHGAFLGVDVFFVLSGFLITSVLLREQERTGRVELWSFYRRRFWRLYPGLVLASGALAAWFMLVPRSWVPVVGTARDTANGAAFALTYTSSWAVAFNGPVGYLGHMWSLSVEEHFYLVWPLVFLYLVRRDRGALPQKTAVLAALAALWPLLLVALHSGSSRVYASPDGRAGQLLVGCLLATLMARPEGLGRLSRLASEHAALFAVAVLALSVVGFRRQYALYLVGGQVVVALASAVLIAHLVLHEERLSRWLSWRPAVRVGTWSYGIYLWHAGVLLVPYAFLGAGIAPRALGALCSVGIAALSLHLVERPLLERFGRRRDEAPAMAVG